MTDSYLTFLENNSHDSAHDLSHIRRVVANSEKILLHESADREVVIAAAWLHDCVILPKNHPDRKRASTMAAEKANDFLMASGFPKSKIEAVSHAIEAHSFSAKIKPETIEAKIVQDADRLDALGAIGIARCFLVGGQIDRPLYNPNDPFCKSRNPDDLKWTIDHFYTKLFKLPETMNTESARQEAKERIDFMEKYLERLGNEISLLPPSTV
jgi:uncharacterized protein